MKLTIKTSVLFLIALAFTKVHAQTNTFPTSGNVGIGTTSPGYLLDIQGTNSNQDLLRLSHPTSPTLAGFIIGFGKNKDQSDNGAIDFKVEYNNTDYSIIGINRANRDFYYNGAGNVGIGTDAPSSNLHITSGTSGSAVVLIEADTDNSGSEDDHPQIQFSQDGGAVIGTVGYKTVGSDNNQLVIENGWNSVSADILFQRSGITNMIIEGDGNVGIGTETPGNELEVNGTIRSKEVLVEATGWPDFVFQEDYELLSLLQLESYINRHGHLPNVPSEADVMEKGINLGEMDATLLQKIEELTLYVIDLKKENDQLKERISTLEEIQN